MKISALALYIIFTIACRAEPAAAPVGLVCASAGAELLGPIDRVDAAALAKTAAEKAKARMGEAPVKAVIVYSFSPYPAAQVMKGVTSVFPKELVCGSQSLGVITQDGGKHSVGVLALGGDVVTATATAQLADGPEKAAATLAAALRDPLAKARQAGQQSVCFLFGELGDGWANLLLTPLAKELGPDVPMTGSGGSELTYIHGEPVGRTIVALLVSGPFVMTHAQATDNTDPAAIVASSQDAMTHAVGKTGPLPRLAFIANCVTRRNKAAVEGEAKALRDAARGATIFGSYGKGEIGPAAKGEASLATTHHILITALSDPAPK